MTEWTQGSIRAAEARLAVRWLGWEWRLNSIQAACLVLPDLTYLPVLPDGPGDLRQRLARVPKFSTGDRLIELMEAVMRKGHRIEHWYGTDARYWVNVSDSTGMCFGSPTLAQALVRAIDGIPEEAE